MVDESVSSFSVSRYDNTYCKIECNNRGCDKLPDEMFILKSVSHLCASGNKISIINPKICQLRQLKSLDLSTNCISALAPEIALLGCLNVLSLQFNSFRQIPVQFCMLSNLRVLRLEGNLQLQFIPCEMALCTQLLQLHVDGCKNLKIPRAKAIFGKVPVAPWLITQKQEPGMNAMNYLRIMFAIISLCAAGKRRAADFSDIYGADMQALMMINSTPWNPGTHTTNTGMALNTDLILPYLSDDLRDNEFEMQIARLVDTNYAGVFPATLEETKNWKSLKTWLKRRFPQFCTNPSLDCAVKLLDIEPTTIDVESFDQILKNLIMIDRICCMLSISPTDEAGFSLYEALSPTCVASRLSRAVFCCSNIESKPLSRNDVFDEIPRTFADLVIHLKNRKVTSCTAQSKFEFLLDGSTLLEQNASFISELKFSRSDYIVSSDIGYGLPNVQRINIDHNHVPEIEISTLSSRIHTLSIKSCQCNMLTFSPNLPFKLMTLCVSKNELKRIDTSIQILSQTLTSLDFSDNKLMELPSLLETFSTLKYLNCSQNLIETSCVNFENLKRLLYLNLSRNKICEINDGLLNFAADSDFNFSEEKEVILNLSDNCIASLPSGSKLIQSNQISALKNVTKFLFGGNPFREIPSDFFMLLDQLESVDFHNMKDVLIPAQNVLHAGIASVRRWFQLVENCRETGHLDLSGYLLNSIEPSVLEECNMITSIDLSNNAFSQVPSILKNVYQCLHTLVFNNNTIAATSEMHFFPQELSCLTLLRLISMECCGLTKIPETIFDLHKLCILKLQSNHINFVNPKLCLLTNLKQLDLRGCPISFPPPSIMNAELPLVIAFLRASSKSVLTDEELPLLEEVCCCEIDYDWDGLQIQWNGHGPAPVPLKCQKMNENLMVSDYDVVWVRNREQKHEWNFSKFPMPCVTENSFWETCESPLRIPNMDKNMADDSEKPTLCVTFDAKPLHLLRMDIPKLNLGTVGRKRASLSKCGVVFTDIPDSICDTLIELCLSFNVNLSLSWLDSNGQLSLPECVRNMKYLRVLCLRGCALDSVPSGLDCLLSLVDLDLSFNKIFTIPVELRKLKELRRLLLDSNPLHAWPPALRSFLKLEMLSMKKCRLREVASSHMQTLTALTSLRLDLNLFNDFPAYFLTKLRAISLNAVHLTSSTLALLLKHSGRLRMLSLSKCNLSSLPDEISFASSLVDLSIDANEISDLPYSFGRCASMFRLQVSPYQIEFPPDSLLQTNSIQNGLTLLRAYEDAVVSKNLILDCVPMEFIPKQTSKLSNLTSLSACECGLTSFGESLESMTNITSLFLNTNNISRLPWYIKDMTSLRTLEINNNPLEFPPIDYVTSKTLDEIRLFVSACFSASQQGFISLSHKSFEIVPSYIFYCDTITSLDISHNHLKNIPDAFAAFTNLQHLNVSHNKLTFINPMLMSISTLSEINVKGNPLDNVPIQVLDVDDSGTYLLVFLQALRRAKLLDENSYISSKLKLDAIEGDQAASFVGFTYECQSAFNTMTFNTLIPLNQRQSEDRCIESGHTDLSEGNWYSKKSKTSALSPYAQGQLDEIITKQMNSQKIDISGANLLLIPPFVCSKMLNANILELKLDNNDLTVMPVALFKCTLYLQKLSARFNWLTCFPVQATRFCPKLMSIDLSHNRFDSAPSFLNECTSLTYLNISNNNIRSLCSSCFAACTLLSDLHVHQNPIESLPSYWTDQHCIKYLGIQGCINLRALPCTLTSTKKLIDIDLCSATKQALQTPAEFVWKGGFAAVKRFLSKISACNDGGACDMSNMNVESLPLHLMSSATAPQVHTCNQHEIGASDARLLALQHQLKNMQNIVHLGIPSSGTQAVSVISKKESILIHAVHLPPGYDSEQDIVPASHSEAREVAFVEYIAPKHKSIQTDTSNIESIEKCNNSITPSALVLDFNPIMNVTFCQIQCDYIQSISLNDCGLKDLPTFVPMWGCLTNLHSLSLDNNLFKSPPSYGLGQLGPSLTQLSLSGCHLEDFPEDLVLKLPFLRHLNIESNDLKTLPNALSNLTCLTTLKMSENNLSSVNFELFGNMSLNELTMFQQKHIHLQDKHFFKLLEGVASRRGAIEIAWVRLHAWSDDSLNEIQPWIARHLERETKVPLSIPSEFRCKSITYSFTALTTWDILRREWQRQIRISMMPN